MDTTALPVPASCIMGTPVRCFHRLSSCFFSFCRPARLFHILYMMKLFHCQLTHLLCFKLNGSRKKKIVL